MLNIEHLKVALDSESGIVKAIDGLTLAIDRGQTFALVGESGCGKSMTALALMRLLPENGRVVDGRIELNGEDTLALPESRMRTVRGRRVAMIFQEPSTSLNPVMQVGEQIVEVATAEEFFAAPKHPYARLLLQALPDTRKRGGTLAAIAGTVPPLWQPFNECRFSDRCDRVFDTCKRVPPGLTELSPTASVRCFLYEPAVVAEAQRRGSAAVPVPPTEAAHPDAPPRRPGAPLLEGKDLRVRSPIRKGLLQRV